MGRESAEKRPPIALESYRDKLLVLAEGSISVSVQNEQMTSRLRAAMTAWLAVAVAALLAAGLSSAMTYYLVSDANARVVEQLDAQRKLLEERIDASFATAQTRSTEQARSILVRADDLNSKIELIPTRIDTAVHGMSESMKDSFLTLRQALRAAAPLPAHSSPILTITRRRPSM